MQRILVILALFALTVPSVAAVSNVEVELTGDGSGNMTLSYTTDANLPRAFALNIYTVNDVNLINVQPVNEPNQEKAYWVFPGSIDIVVGDINDYGTPEANAVIYPGTWSGNKAFTIEMGSLYVPGDGNDPCTSGGLITFQVEGSGSYCIDVNENSIRGGVVMEDPNEDPNVTFDGYCYEEEVECFPSGHDDYQAWLDRESPNCWCNPRQCRGEAEGIGAAPQGDKKQGYYYVASNDLSVLAACWDTALSNWVKEPTKGPGILESTYNGHKLICADFAHDIEGDKKQGYYYVSASDLSILAAAWDTALSNWIKEPTKGPGITPDCLD